MIFSDNFLESITLDPISRTIEILPKVELNLSTGDSWTEGDYDVLIEALALVKEICDANLLPIYFSPPQVSGVRNDDCKASIEFLRIVHNTTIAEKNRLRFESLQSRFKSVLGSGFMYEFSQGDLDRIQQLINELRALISKLTTMEPEHQQRLLKRLERLQSELHKKVSDLDRFWGLIGDAGVVLGKLGTDAKPIVDRIREIAGITWQTQSRAEELPSGTQIPSLENHPHTEA